MQPGKHLMACEMVIENEINHGAKRKDVALTYAMTIRSECAGRPTDWTRINATILAKWGARGLAAVKKRAWGIVEGRIDPTAN
ncbi:MAG: hypothetical protein IPK59_23285 [Rhodospirillaceae bacterium]|nr:hypothetical protein [Rhodospirillaceae bacterium]